MKAAKGASKRPTYHHGDLRNSLLEASLELLKEQGLDALSLREVARRVGVNHRAAYRHFEDKRALLAAIAADGYRKLAAKMREQAEVTPEASPLDGMVTLARAYVAFGLQHRALYEVMFGPRLNEDARFPDLEAAMLEAAKVLSRQLARLSPDAPGRVIRDRGIGVWALVHGLVDLTLVRRVRVRPELAEDYAEGVIRPMLKGLAE